MDFFIVGRFRAVSTPIKIECGSLGKGHVHQFVWVCLPNPMEAVQLHGRVKLGFSSGG